MQNFNHPFPPLTEMQLLQEQLNLWISAVHNALFRRMETAALAVAATILDDEDGDKWLEEAREYIGELMNGLPHDTLLRITQEGHVEVALDWAIASAQRAAQSPNGAVELMEPVWQELQRYSEE